MKLKKYILNCFLLLVPILIWNIVLAAFLPEAFSPDVFWNDIPDWVSYGENISRIAIMVIPALMSFSLKKRIQKIGLKVYLFGTVLYFFSWILLIVYPNSDWGQSVLGFMAPAYTPIIWLIGIGLIGNNSFFEIKNLTFFYILLSLLFIMFHMLHTYIVYQKTMI